IPIAERIWLKKAAAGPERRIGLNHLLDVYVIWKFSENIEGAKQFLIDYVGQSRKVFLASQFYNFPCYPDTIPDINKLISYDSKATPHDKYNIFKDVTKWTTNVGYPGYANAPSDEIFSQWIISTMFTQAASGKMTPQDALAQGVRESKKIFDKWRAIGMT
ncbi:MAG: carbohydrate ABC transporter substrate-binding protein, partial [Deltaproteobacteria bacterium]|nr:carbohydrate ABC transporter substrate-binding protein [Deltaproteobacteria bacterium]